MKVSRIARPIRALAPTFCLIAFVFLPAVAHAESIYLGLTGYPSQSVASVNSDGSGFTTISTNHAFVLGALALDAVNNKLYFGDASNPGGTDKLYRSNLDGSGVQTIATLDSGVNGVFADATSGKLFIGTDGGLYSSNLDGTNKTLLSGGQSNAVKVYNSQIYFNDSVNIYRENLDGSNKTTLVSGGNSNITSIVGFDVVGSLGKLFYSDQDHGTVSSANLDGTGVFQIASAQSFPGGVAYDSTNNRVFWGGGQSLKSANLDGTGFTSAAISGIESSNEILTLLVVPSAVPEPSSLILSAAGLALTAVMAARRTRAGRRVA